MLNFRATLANLVNRNEHLFLIKQEADILRHKLFVADGAHYSWSQYGEDELFVNELAAHLSDGFYVDVGANHPTKISNTYRLYCLGMRGITIEPNPVLHQLHMKYRPGDIHLCLGVSKQDGLLPFYRFTNHVLSIFSADECRVRLSQGMHLLSQNPIPVLTIRTILSGCSFPERSVFSLLTIDTEALDEIVLSSNDWSRYKPKIICVEQCGHGDAIARYLEPHGYAKIAERGVNEIYKAKC